MNFCGSSILGKYSGSLSHHMLLGRGGFVIRCLKVTKAPPARLTTAAPVAPPCWVALSLTKAHLDVAASTSLL